MKNYKEWFIYQWNLHGGLITQAQAARILEKTPTRIRQMINEKKIDHIAYNDEAPLISFTHLLKIYEIEEALKKEKEEKEFEKQFPYEYEYNKIMEQKEYQDYIDSLTPEDLENIEKRKKEKLEAQKKLKELQKKKEEIEEQEIAQEKIINEIQFYEPPEN